MDSLCGSAAFALEPAQFALESAFFGMIPRGWSRSSCATASRPLSEQQRPLVRFSQLYSYQRGREGRNESEGAREFKTENRGPAELRSKKENLRCRSPFVVL